MEDSELFRKRKEKIEALQREGIPLYPNDVRVTATTEELRERFAHSDAAALAAMDDEFSLAGRLMAVRNFGKAAFLSLQDRKGRIQGYVHRDLVGTEAYALFRRLDVGDIVFLQGRVFRTKTGELTVEARTVRLLSKAYRPLPEKWHGLTDIETRYRQRHLDLIANPAVQEVFRKRSRIIRLIRGFLDDRDFLEVETPMMQPRPGGAVARPFRTHHNALGIDLYLRIAPELYLKRLVTGGIERVYELNRNFRNEGLSTTHNPEFTMVEFYQAYATYEDLMTLTEDLIVFLAQEILGGMSLSYQGASIDLAPPWRRVTVRDAVADKIGNPGLVDDPAQAAALARNLGLEISPEDPPGKILMALFEVLVEPHLVQPTFVTLYPIEASPLSRRNDRDPSLADRFELYIAGREIANAFSELNDPVDQRNRFVAQIAERARGDEEAHVMDEDYLQVLETAMPPTAGEGIGIDRLVMLFTDSASIRDVILFPQMRERDA